MRRKRMKHRDLLGITVDELINNYVHVYVDQDGDYGYYIGIMELKDAQKLPSKYWLNNLTNSSFRSSFTKKNGVLESQEKGAYRQSSKS